MPEMNLEPSTEELLQQKKAVFMISGEINDNHLGICYELLNLHFDDDFDEHVTLLINSPGGLLSISWAIIDVMDFVRYPVHTVCIGQVASAAADIFISGDDRVMAANSTLMIHSHSTGYMGTVNNLIKSMRGDILEQERRIRHYVSNSTLTEEEVKSILLSGHDNYYSPKECLDMGMTDEVAKPTHKQKRNKSSRFAVGKIKANPKPKGKVKS